MKINNVEEYSDEDDEDYIVEDDPLYKQDQLKLHKKVFRTSSQKQKITNIW
jgi:hypothetical protein